MGNGKWAMGKGTFSNEVHIHPGKVVLCRHQTSNVRQGSQFQLIYYLIVHVCDIHASRRPGACFISHQRVDRATVYLYSCPSSSDIIVQRLSILTKAFTMFRSRPVYSQLRPAGMSIDAVATRTRASEPLYPSATVIAKSSTYTDCEADRAQIKD